MVYKVSNWRDYNKALINRGNITFWFNDDIISEWHASNSGAVGRPKFYADAAIKVALTLRELFKLPLRTTQGLLLALKKLLKLNIAVPNYTTLSRRQKSLDIKIPKFGNSSGPVNVAIDSTGLKIFGEGEWKVKIHGKSKRRTWRKLHICIDINTQNILSAVLTKANIHDAKIIDEVMPEEAEQIMVDGIYDTFGVYNSVIANNSHPVIPPRKNAAVKDKDDVATVARNRVVSFCHKFGISVWKKMSGYHKRSLVETAMSRLKRIFSGKLKNRAFQNQITESNIRCSLINHFNKLGMPESFKI